MVSRTKKVPFKNRLVMLGCGSIGQGVLPLIFRHIDIRPEQMAIIEAVYDGEVRWVWTRDGEEASQAAEG